ncbi:MAG: hypothetical protein ACYCZ6_16925 [Polaromonas sp.]
MKREKILEGISVNSRKRKRRVSQLFHSRLHSARFFWESAEDGAWDYMAPVGREFGSPDYDRLMQQDLADLRSNLSNLIDKCSDSLVESRVPLDATEHKQAVNVQIALHDLGQDVNVDVATAVWRHYFNSLTASSVSGAETVASAKKSLYFYCTGKATD